MWTCRLHFSHLLPSLWKKITSDRRYSSLDTCSLKKHLVFIQRTGRCHLFYVRSRTFQRLASWLDSPSESHLVHLYDSQLHGEEASILLTSLAVALPLICLSPPRWFTSQSLRFIVSWMWKLMTDYFSAEMPPSKSLSRALSPDKTQRL